jgi:excisionase family DNA binding protein
MTTAVEPVWLRPRSAAQLVDLSLSTFYAGPMRSGELEIARLGRSVRISRASLLAWIERRAEVAGRREAS